MTPFVLAMAMAGLACHVSSPHRLAIGIDRAAMADAERRVFDRAAAKRARRAARGW